MTATGSERRVSGPPADRGLGEQARANQARADHAASQSDGLRVLMAIAVSPPDDVAGPPWPRSELPPGPTAPERAVPELAGPEALADVAAPETGTRQGHKGTARSGRHAAAPPPYLDRPGVRFLLFSAIGGFVFLMGLGMQVALTGEWHLPAIWSYLAQAVASVETSLLLNRWLTWRDRSTPFWIAFARFNAQKTVTIALNLVLYAGLLHLGMNYLVANVALTVLFTIVNYVAGDRLVFISGRTRETARTAATAGAATLAAPREMPAVSAVIPCRGNEHTIAEAVVSLLDQDYPGLREIMLIGSPGDSTWRGLDGIDHPRLSMWEMETPPGVRDANFKRDTAVRMTSGDVIALVDSDIMLPPDWMSRAVDALRDSGVGCVAGGMKSYHDSFWGRYTDSTWIGAKTPRIGSSYTVTSSNFGARGRKPPILANTLFTRELYEKCPIDPMWSHGSYEDYEWFWRVVKAGNAIRVCRDLFGWHHHRRGLRALTREYRRSARGCAYFIRAHPDSPLAKRRRRQAITLPLAAAAVTTAAVGAAAVGYGLAFGGLLLGCAATLIVHQVARSKSLESVGYPVVGFVLGLVFTVNLVTNLIGARADPEPLAVPDPVDRSVSRTRRLLPMTAICAIQAGLSLTLIWSNTAYVDEANYLWIGRLEIAHWLHGATALPADAYRALPGSPFLYPVVGAIANSAGGLAGARILSLVFMILATILLYLTAQRLIGRTGALFAAALWAFSEPALRLAFATADPLSVLLTALAAWLIVSAGRRRVGELIALAGVCLAVANMTAYAGLLIDPVLIAFALAAWNRLQVQHALSRTVWLTAAWATSFGLLMTASHSWPWLLANLPLSSAAGDESTSAVLADLWGYAGLIVGLAVVAAILLVQTGGSDGVRSRHSNATVFSSVCVAAYLVMLLRDQTPWTSDKHIAYCVWFAAIAAGYACGRFIQWVPVHRRELAAVCCAAVLIYPAAISWQSAWERYHAWPNASTFVAKLRPLAAHVGGAIYVPGHETNIAEYYTPQGRDASRWRATISLNPVGVPKGAWSRYYLQQLSQDGYSVIVLFYSTTFSSADLPVNKLLSDSSSTYDYLLNDISSDSGEPGLSVLTHVLDTDASYHEVAWGPYNTSNISGTHDFGVFAIWRKVPG